METDEKIARFVQSLSEEDRETLLRLFSRPDVVAAVEEGVIREKAEEEKHGPDWEWLKIMDDFVWFD